MANAARGEFVFFLNNDTVVTAGWLQALLCCFSEEADAGLVGARLVYPDGRLQEAGGIVWRDASGAKLRHDQIVVRPFDQRIEPEPIGEDFARESRVDREAGDVDLGREGFRALERALYFGRQFR